MRRVIKQGTKRGRKARKAKHILEHLEWLKYDSYKESDTGDELCVDRFGFVVTRTNIHGISVERPRRRPHPGPALLLVEGERSSGSLGGATVRICVVRLLLMYMVVHGTAGRRLHRMTPASPEPMPRESAPETERSIGGVSELASRLSARESRRNRRPASVGFR